ncbi:metallophosphoesterase family protein [Rhodopirellula halodulae]|uniref:metallophosphoesterase family protein n=1 Tax=Rhodopirellula halodulae TaxID=2894198 RepID=UPI001E5FE69D|nr:metallophosphoesterase family protein [Rhodopirellula sp. JC737]MCC9658161.1 serine/threonine protein phosphatase [Rhodopirellula sp. JC737]
MSRYVIGDIHGCAKALRSMIEVLSPTQNDELIFLGDYIDRGPDSRDVVDQLIELQSKCQVVALRGNHEWMLQSVVARGLDDAMWLRSGGKATITSYGGSIQKIPGDHLEFFDALLPHHQTEREIFVHAMYNPTCEVHEQDDELTYWAHLPTQLPAPHCTGRRVFVGHTPQPSGEVLRHTHLVCMDTYCFGGGYLSAMDLEMETILQVDRHGHVRRVPVERVMMLLRGCASWFRKGEADG